MHRSTEKHLKELGLRVTAARVLMLGFFNDAKKPYSASEILEYLRNENLKTDEATVYRNIKVFLEKNILREADLRREDQKFYELKSLPHYHHFVCKNCSDVFPIHACGISHMQKDLEKKGFSVISHSLEFFGVCKKCKK